jgi:hypothetical protein
MTTNPIFQNYIFQLTNGFLEDGSTPQEFLQHQLTNLISQIDVQKQLSNGKYFLDIRLTKVRDGDVFVPNSKTETFEESYYKHHRQLVENCRRKSQGRL